jgi:hypothetical protein
MNFGEEVAYWYLRFNGFFPLPNFVLHRTDRRKASDCDVLAVRPPHVFEEVGGNQWDWDQRLEVHWAEGRTVGVICEVKSGIRIRSIFQNDRVMHSVRRLGFAEDLAPEEWESLHEEGFVDLGSSHRILKLLVADYQPRGYQRIQFVSIDYAREFLKQRVRNYHEKQGDWVFFKSNLMQDLIWEVRLEVKNAQRRQRGR